MFPFEGGSDWQYERKHTSLLLTNKKSHLIHVLNCVYGFTLTCWGTMNQSASLWPWISPLRNKHTAGKGLIRRWLWGVLYYFHCVGAWQVCSEGRFLLNKCNFWFSNTLLSPILLLILHFLATREQTDCHPQPPNQIPEREKGHLIKKGSLFFIPTKENKGPIKSSPLPQPSKKILHPTPAEEELRAVPGWHKQLMCYQN